jgi:putative ABC transport system permease protein
MRAALVALMRNKMRSVLTVLGITIGIAAVICVVAIGKAGQARVEQQLNNLGDNFVWIEAGGRAVNGVRTGTHDTKTLTVSDAIALKNQISIIKSVSPNVDDPVQVIYGNQNWHTSYRGGSPEYFDINRWFVDQGAIFSQDDVDRAADVCVIGRTVREQVFGMEDPVGKVMRINNIPCKVVATLQAKGLSLSGQDQDDTVILQTRQRRRRSKGSPGSTTSCAPPSLRSPSRSRVRKRRPCCATGTICARRRRTISTSGIPKTSFRRSSTRARR